MTDTIPPATLILIDDHEDSREVVAAWLRMEGWSVLEFERAEPALDAVLQGGPCIVLTDLTLPGMSGADLASRLRDEASLLGVPIIALTGRSDVAFGPGELFDELVVKPFDPEELLAAVARAASSRVSRTLPLPSAVVPGQRISGTSTGS
jgi:DNA-binding response OmpR family regulator